MVTKQLGVRLRRQKKDYDEEEVKENLSLLANADLSDHEK